MGIDGQTVIITGGASGIGKATSYELSRRGAKTAIVDLNGSQVEELTRDLQTEFKHTDIIGITANVCSEDDMAKMAAEVLEKLGSINILVHCAGILRPKDSGPKLLHQTSLEEWNAVIDTNLKGTFLANRAVVPEMLKKQKGHIINISSTSGLKGRPFDSVYCASKFGMIGLSEALAEEVKHKGIRVHVVLPDAVDTPIWEQNGPIQAPDDALAPSRVAHLITYLAGLPEDTVLDNLVIRSFQTRRRKKNN